LIVDAHEADMDARPSGATKFDFICSAFQEQLGVKLPLLTDFLIERTDFLPMFPFSNEKEHVMKLATIALAIAFALPTTFASAEGAMNLGDSVPRSSRGVTANTTRPIATRPRNLSGNTLAPIMGDPSGSTLTPSAMSRGG
jgi:hypothetical protein